MIKMSQKRKNKVPDSILSLSKGFQANFSGARPPKKQHRIEVRDSQSSNTQADEKKSEIWTTMRPENQQNWAKPMEAKSEKSEKDAPQKKTTLAARAELRPKPVLKQNDAEKTVDKVTAQQSISKPASSKPDSSRQDTSKQNSSLHIEKSQQDQPAKANAQKQNQLVKVDEPKHDQLAKAEDSKKDSSLKSETIKVELKDKKAKDSTSQARKKTSDFPATQKADTSPTAQEVGDSSVAQKTSSSLAAQKKVAKIVQASTGRKSAKTVNDMKSKNGKSPFATEIKLANLPNDDRANLNQIRRENEEKVKLAKSRNDQRRRHTMPIFLRVLFSVLLLVGTSVLFTWFILWRQNLCEVEPTENFITNKPALFTYSCIIIFCLMAIIASLTWRIFFTLGLSFSIISVITFINIQKFKLRATPLVPEDFLMADQAGNLTQFVDMGSIVRLVIGVIFIMVGAIFLEYCAGKVIGRDKRGLAWWDRFALIPRASFLMASLAAFSLIAHPILTRNPPEWLEDIDLVGWNQAENYLKNGFVIGFLYNFGKLSVDPPEDYNEETMQAVAEKYRAKKKADENSPESERKPIDEIAENIVVVLDETFYDPELLTKYYSHRGGDPLPNLRRIFRDYPSGYMYSPEYGGNTANVEFEIQTGLSNYWANSMPYVNSIPKTHGVLSVANWAKELGFETTAIHTYDGTFYKRNWVYPLLGYNTFIDEDLMTHTEKEHLSLYINDRSVFNEVLDTLRDNDDPQMIAAVTMQNHSPYNIAQYPELNFPLIEADNVFLEHSFESLYHADEYVGEFLDALDRLDEPTVVLWFGDHAAGLLDAYTQSEEKIDRDFAHLTPYFIYANFDIESMYTPAEVAEMNEKLGFELPELIARNVDLPIVSPNCLQNTMYNIIGAEKPALFYLVDEICQEVPVLTLAYLGNTILEQTEALHDYELVSYDVLGGGQYWDGK